MRQGILAVAFCGLLGGCALTGPVATPETVDTSKIMIRADLDYKNGDFKAAEQSYRKVTKHSPSNATAQYWLGNSLAQQNRFGEAIEAYKTSLEHDANNTQTYNNLATLYMLQAQAVLTSGVDHIPANNGNAAQIKHRLWQLKKITPGKLQAN